MSKNTLLATLLALPLLAACGSTQQSDSIEYTNSIRIDSTDSPEFIVQKAAHVVPTANQLAALRNEYIAFIHFGINTFTGMEWGSGFEDPKIFGLKELDTDQWCKAMSEAGMTMVIFTAKHHDGFCLWQTRYTDHSIASTGFENGKGDVMRDLSKSCQKYGLKLGVYLSPADLYHIENPEGLYGNLSQYTKRTIPRPVEGREFEDKRTFEFVVDDYNEYFLNQLFELLTEYGDIHEVWFDGAHPKTKGGQTYNYKAWKELIHTLAPEAVIFGKEDVRWCGNEGGGTRETEFNVVAYTADPDTSSYFADMTDIDLGSREVLKQGNFLHYQQAEVNTSIREGWFYRDDTNQGVRSADDVFDIYERAVGGNATFLLNIPPNKEGKFSPRDVACLIEVGKRIEETYGVNLLDSASGNSDVLDQNPDTFVEVEVGEYIEISTPEPITLNRLVIQEAIDKRSERVESHTLEAMVDGKWQEIITSTNIGYKRILRFSPITTQKLRIGINKARLTPAICTITAHYYNSRPPELTMSQAADGSVKIEPKVQKFNWKLEGKMDSEQIDYKIYYTTDGTQPTLNSTHYTEPILLENCELQAVAVADNRIGSVSKKAIGYAKKSWKLHSASSEAKGFEAKLAFDANEQTFWKSQAGKNQSIAVDLGKQQKINAIAYTPQTANSEGMIQKGVIEISSNGKQWQRVEEFEFGNLINDPTQRFHYLKSSVEARFLRITAKEIAAGGNTASMAELDIY